MKKDDLEIILWILRSIECHMSCDLDDSLNRIRKEEVKMT